MTVSSCSGAGPAGSEVCAGMCKMLGWDRMLTGCGEEEHWPCWAKG